MVEAKPSSDPILKYMILNIDTESLTQEQRNKLIEIGLMKKVCEACGQDVPVQNEYLKQVDTVTLYSCNGSKFIANAKDVFKSYIDSDFKNFDLDKSGAATNETQVSVYEMAKSKRLTKDATLVQMFTSLNSDLNTLCLSQSQIIDFCEKNADKLHQEDVTFFLFKENNEFFVALVHVHSDGLSVFVHRLEYGDMWLSSGALRLVVPQLKL